MCCWLRCVRAALFFLTCDMDVELRRVGLQSWRNEETLRNCAFRCRREISGSGRKEGSVKLRWSTAAARSRCICQRRASGSCGGARLGRRGRRARRLGSARATHARVVKADRRVGAGGQDGRALVALGRRADGARAGACDRRAPLSMKNVRCEESRSAIHGFGRPLGV